MSILADVIFFSRWTNENEHEIDNDKIKKHEKKITHPTAAASVAIVRQCKGNAWKREKIAAASAAAAAADVVQMESARR